MHYRLNDNIALRGWPDLPHAYYEKGLPLAGPLTAREFLALLLCDGKTELGPSTTLASLEQRGYICQCEQGDVPSAWSRYRRYHNAYMPKMNLMLTGRCNYNCLHCFNAADNTPLMSEWDFYELCGLLDMARDCGINCLTLTGGEPMLHPRFMDVLSEIHSRGMYVEHLNTNGFFITQGVLDQMRGMGCTPTFKISFDGVGFHDWMRARRGAEQRALDAIGLCVRNGFEVWAQTQVNRRNLGSMRETLTLMEQLGVSAVRLIRTTESDRWALNAGDACLTFPEYYQSMLELAAWYAAEPHAMKIFMWLFLALDPQAKEYSLLPVMSPAGTYVAQAPVCQGNRTMVAVGADGEVMPCLQMSGHLLAHGMSFGNVHDKSLQELLSDGPYLRAICRGVGELREANDRCGSCRFFECCCGGCRALGFLLSGDDMDGSDPSKCLFFKDGWYARITEALAGWQNLTPIPKGLAQP